MQKRQSHSLQKVAAVGILNPSSLFLIACPPATDGVRVRNLSANTAKLTFIFLPGLRPDGGPRTLQDPWVRRKTLSEGVSFREPDGEAFMPDASYLRATPTGYIATNSPQYTMWSKSYKAGGYSDNGLPDMPTIDAGGEHRTFTRDELKKRFRTHRSRGLY